MGRDDVAPSSPPLTVDGRYTGDSADAIEYEWGDIPAQPSPYGGYVFDYDSARFHALLDWQVTAAPLTGAEWWWLDLYATGGTSLWTVYLGERTCPRRPARSPSRTSSRPTCSSGRPTACSRSCPRARSPVRCSCASTRSARRTR